MSKFGMLGGLAVALSKLIPLCFQNPILSRTLTVNLLPSAATVCSCTEHLGEVRTVGAERTPCKRCGKLGLAVVTTVEERPWWTTRTVENQTISYEVFNELISPSRTPASFALPGLSAFLVERVIAGRVADAFGLLRSNAVTCLGFTQELARAWWTDKFHRASECPLVTQGPLE